MNADDLQACMWFAEKDLWEKKSWMKPGTAGAEKSSLDVPFHAAYPQGPLGRQLRHTTVRSKLQSLLDEPSDFAKSALEK